MEAIILCGGKAERLGDAAGGRPKSLVEVAGRPLAAYQVARLAKAGVDRVIISCAAGQGELFERELAGLGAEIVAAEEPERLGRGGGISFAAQARARERRRLRAERRRARRGRLRGAARAPPRGRRRRDGRRRAAELAVRRRRPRRGRRGHRLQRGRLDPLLGELRHLRPLRGGDRALPRARRPRDDDVPGARRGGRACSPTGTTGSG